MDFVSQGWKVKGEKKSVKGGNSRVDIRAWLTRVHMCVFVAYNALLTCSCWCFVIHVLPQGCFHKD